MSGEKKSKWIYRKDCNFLYSSLVPSTMRRLVYLKMYAQIVGGENRVIAIDPQVCRLGWLPHILIVCISLALGSGLGTHRRSTLLLVCSNQCAANETDFLNNVFSDDQFLQQLPDLMHHGPRAECIHPNDISVPISMESFHTELLPLCARMMCVRCN
jgi:hypothetical protein